MEIVETGDFDRAKQFLGDSVRTDEIGMLNQEFHVMLDKIDFLIHENYEKQLLLKDTKYKMLQAQINPHFLYNTLNSINWMIRAKRNGEAAEMTVALGTILRSALSKEQYSTLESEITNSYLIPHMTLQPHYQGECRR